MKDIRLEYTEQFTPGPLSFWVHKQAEGRIWMDSETFVPPLPAYVPGKGYPRVIITFDDVDLVFSSIEELIHFKEVISPKNIPTPLQLSQKRGTKKGPNSHWLSRLPSNI